MKFDRQRIVGPCGILDRFKATGSRYDPTAIDLGAEIPLFHSLDPTKTQRVLEGSVDVVLREISYPNIGPAVVQAITIDVVNQHIARRLKNESVHANTARPSRLSGAPTSPGIEFFGALVGMNGIPVVSRNKIEILIVDNGEQTAVESDPLHAAALARAMTGQISEAETAPRVMASRLSANSGGHSRLSRS